jgi:hypothetical protein
MNIDKMIDALVQDDFDSIMSGDAIELLNSYLEFGHKGYRDYSEMELEQECYERGLIINDSEVDEMQEWHDFDQDC